MRLKLDERVSHWLTVFQLQAPFPDADTIFPPNRVRVTGTALHALPPELVLTRTPCIRNVELQAVFAAPAHTPTTKLGVTLNTTTKEGYSFLILLGNKGEEGLNPPLLPPPPKTLRLQILRNNNLLRESDVPADKLLEGRWTLRGCRVGEQLTFQVNDLEPLEVSSPFPLSSAEPGVFGLVWPATASLNALRRHNSSWPRNPFLWRPATRNTIRGTTTQHANFIACSKRRRREARWPRPLVTRRGYAISPSSASAKRSPLPGVGRKRGDRWPVLADCQLLFILLTREDVDSAVAADAVFERLKGRGLPPDRFALLVPFRQREKLLGLIDTVHIDVFKEKSLEKRIPLKERQFELRRLLLLDTTADTLPISTPAKA